MVRHIIPESLHSALSYLNEGTFQVVAGGTDLMIQKRNTAGTLPRFEKDMLYLANLTELQYVRKIQSSIHIGATTTLEDIMENHLTPDLLKKVIQEMASPAIRHVATLAGNIGNASPAGDSLVALYLLDTRIVVASLLEEREIPIQQFIKGVKKTTLAPNEMIREIVIPVHSFDAIVWQKVGGRRADAISKVSFAGAYRLEDGKVNDVRLAFGAISTTIIRDRQIERDIMGTESLKTEAYLQQITDKYALLMSPIDDQRSSKEYRKTVAINLAKSFLKKLKEAIT
jgi:xanthine dehydrogenase FAD-binding subunit